MNKNLRIIVLILAVATLIWAFVVRNIWMSILPLSLMFLHSWLISQSLGESDKRIQSKWLQYTWFFGVLIFMIFALIINCN
ncbi:MAG: hypothetical protein J5I52_01075 [Saprospiraceae bacterium]|nr:MAG: hypothetical protein UZ09_BCD002002186 [Bacteroidetes bacterium OLB9]MCO6462717.1 hypothetical protein [Saprospiraceae bacterium]MCZ2340022.1 hypothetical protein [Chitinophagales bacterium]